MAYDSERHHRRSIRLKDYDYSQNGAYFVTLCTFDRGCYFAQFPELMAIVDEQWRRIPERFPAAIMNEYIVMPNHFHGIIVIDNGIEQHLTDTRNQDTRKGYPYKSRLWREGRIWGTSSERSNQCASMRG